MGWDPIRGSIAQTTGCPQGEINRETIDPLSSLSSIHKLQYKKAGCKHSIYGTVRHSGFCCFIHMQHIYMCWSKVMLCAQQLISIQKNKLICVSVDSTCWRCLQSVMQSLIFRLCGISSWAALHHSAIWGSMAGLTVITHNAERLYTQRHTQNLSQPQEPRVFTGERNWFDLIIVTL